MTDLQLDEVTEVDVEVEPTNGGTNDGLCHIEDGSMLRMYCGKLNEDGGVTCAPYKGEAICPSCGAPTCPDCAAMQSLNERLGG